VENYLPKVAESVTVVNRIVRCETQDVMR